MVEVNKRDFYVGRWMWRLLHHQPISNRKPKQKSYDPGWKLSSEIETDLRFAKRSFSCRRRGWDAY